MYLEVTMTIKITVLLSYVVSAQELYHTQSSSATSWKFMILLLYDFHYSTEVFQCWSPASKQASH